MIIQYKYHEGSQPTKPLAIDITSSKTVVYLRKNIRQITREDEMSGEPVTMWGYDEARLSRDEYELYKDEIMSEGLGGLEEALCDIDETASSRLDDIEEALCELSELLQ